MPHPATRAPRRLPILSLQSRMNMRMMMIMMPPHDPHLLLWALRPFPPIGHPSRSRGTSSTNRRSRRTTFPQLTPTRTRAPPLFTSGNAPMAPRLSEANRDTCIPATRRRSCPSLPWWLITITFIGLFIIITLFTVVAPSAETAYSDKGLCSSLVRHADTCALAADVSGFVRRRGGRGGRGAMGALPLAKSGGARVRVGVS